MCNPLHRWGGHVEFIHKENPTPAAWKEFGRVPTGDWRSILGLFRYWQTPQVRGRELAQADIDDVDSRVC